MDHGLEILKIIKLKYLLNIQMSGTTLMTIDGDWGELRRNGSVSLQNNISVFFCVRINDRSYKIYYQEPRYQAKVHRGYHNIIRKVCHIFIVVCYQEINVIVISVIVCLTFVINIAYDFFF